MQYPWNAVSNGYKSNLLARTQPIQLKNSVHNSNTIHQHLHSKIIYIIIRFPIGLNFLFITFRLYFFFSLTYSLSISSSGYLLPGSLSVSLGFHLYLCSPYISPHHMSIPSQSTTFNNRCNRFNSTLLSQFFTGPI